MISEISSCVWNILWVRLAFLVSLIPFSLSVFSRFFFVRFCFFVRLYPLFATAHLRLSTLLPPSRHLSSTFFQKIVVRSTLTPLTSSFCPFCFLLALVVECLRRPRFPSVAHFLRTRADLYEVPPSTFCPVFCSPLSSTRLFLLTFLSFLITSRPFSHGVYALVVIHPPPNSLPTAL